jgi:shikimate kinase
MSSAPIRPRVVLVGAPGAGKTTTGRLVAERLGVTFRDTDADVVEATGMSIADLFVLRGEDEFRALERAAVRTALAEHPGVLALGGGAVVDPETRALLKDHTVVHLDVTLADAAARVGFNRDRPLLVGNVRAQLHAMLEQRRPFYAEVATATVSTHGRSGREVADAVLDVLTDPAATAVGDPA